MRSASTTKKLFLVSLVFFITAVLFADKKSDEIARKYYDLKKSDDSYSIGLMVIINKRGEKKTRKIEMYSKETKEGTNSFVKFLEPADVKGTKFLTIGHKKGDDEQRLYLPALGKVRRISSSKKDGTFMGSDLNYFDMENHVFEDFTYKYIKDKTYKDMDCYVIEASPLDKNAPYSKQVLWINKKDYFVYKSDCYDKKSDEKLLKTIVITEIKIINDVIIPVKIVVDNHQTKGKTLFMMDNVKINVGLKNNIFSIQNLEK